MKVNDGVIQGGCMHLLFSFHCCICILVVYLYYFTIANVKTLLQLLAEDIISLILPLEH